MSQGINKSLKLSAVALAVALAAPMSAHANEAREGWYANISGGIAKVDNKVNYTARAEVGIPENTTFSNLKTKTGYRASGAVGYKMGPFRMEGELSHISAKNKNYTLHTTINNDKTVVSSNGKTSATALMANVYYDFDDVAEGITPYVGVGVGGARVETKLSNNQNLASAEFKSTQVAGQAIAGVRFDVAENIALNADYRYLRTANTNAGGAFQSHSANLGLTVFFG